VPSSTGCSPTSPHLSDVPTVDAGSCRYPLNAQVVLGGSCGVALAGNGFANSLRGSTLR
jgi:hypothetical protein